MKNCTKKALISSAVSLVLCFSMLLGTTYAWFTDSVTSANNVIQTGTLDIAMYWADGDENPDTASWKDASEGAIFNSTVWEPGYIAARHIKIANEGTLSLKYKLFIAPDGEVSELADVIDVYYIEGATAVTRDVINAATPVGTLRDMINDPDGAAYGFLTVDNEATTDVDESIATATIAFVLSGEVGNEYQDLSIGSSFAIQLVATQYNGEFDSLGNDYDEGAEYPAVSSSVITNPAAATPVSVNYGGKNISVTVPAGVAGAGDVFTASVSNGAVTTNAEDYTKTVAYDITLLKNNAKIDAVSGVTYPVEIQAEPGMTISAVKHKGVELASFDYDPITGILTFETDSFSPFEIVYSMIPSDAVASVASADGKKKYYTDLAEAFANVSDGATITLMNNVTVENTLIFDKDVSATLDLGGYAISGKITTILKISDGSLTVLNGSIKNVHEAATETKYSIYMSGDAKAKITSVSIETSGTGIYLTDDAYISELSANVKSFHTANGSCAYDAVCLSGNARIELISGGEYSNYYTDEYIQWWYENRSLSETISYTVNLISDGASIGEISGGEFLGIMDKANNGAVIHVNEGSVEKISGGYFGFYKSGLSNPIRLLYVNTTNGASIGEITGGTYEVGSLQTGFGCDFAGIVDNSGCKTTDLEQTVTVYLQFSNRVAEYTLNVITVEAK